MKIAVVGIGVAGAYLMNRLSDDHNNHLVGFERMPNDKHDAVCAWATCENVMAGLARIRSLTSMTMSCTRVSTCRWTWRKRAE